MCLLPGDNKCFVRYLNLYFLFGKLKMHFYTFYPKRCTVGSTKRNHFCLLLPSRVTLCENSGCTVGSTKRNHFYPWLPSRVTLSEGSRCTEKEAKDKKNNIIGISRQECKIKQNKVIFTFSLEMRFIRSFLNNKLISSYFWRN